MYDLSGSWQADIGEGSVYPIQLPGTLDENGIGHKDIGANQWHPEIALGNAKEDFDKEAPIATRFTRKYTYEGPVRLCRHSDYQADTGKRVFLEAERARCLSLFVNGRQVPDFTEPSLSTPHIFEVTGLLTGNDEVVLVSDNSYPGLPHDDIVYASAATDETQTNWNGVLGYLRLREEEMVFFHSVRVYPYRNNLTVKIDISAAHAWTGTLRICSEALGGEVEKEAAVSVGMNELVIEKLALSDSAQRWEEDTGICYTLTVSAKGMADKTVHFGVRDFGDDGTGRLALNGRRIFLRSESNCAVFPENGHPPMAKQEWTEILKVYQAYGVNCMRFHSWCPPEAAFAAADELGMLMQPELSCWNPNNAFETQEGFAYYQTELKQILLMLANHPSFVMLTLGNELHAGELGHERMNGLLVLAHSLDDTRLYANGSNVHYGSIGCDNASDFYASQKFKEDDLRATFAGEQDGLGIRGSLNNTYPNAQRNYNETMEHLRREYAKPVFSFEVGQYEVLPDFRELVCFQGVTEPDNYRLIRSKVEQAGLLPEWERYVEATGELARLCYREEVEAVMRTEGMSGISLLGLQDFPGQGTALVGMLNSHLEPKPYSFAKPEAFRTFFTDQLPLALLPQYTYTVDETLKTQVKVANYGKKILSGSLTWRLEGEGICKKGELQNTAAAMHIPIGALYDAGMLEILLTGIEKAVRLDLTVEISGIHNCYPIWVYPKVTPVCPHDVYETEYFDEQAREVLQAGGKVYLTPSSTKEAIPSSIRAQFSTDFWSVGTFAGQEGGMGQLIDTAHPIFEGFPTESHTNWQWWPMAVQRAFILPKPYEAIITEMDSYAFLRPMAQLLEGKCLNGRILMSSMGLQNLQQYPEARALLDSIYHYLGSEQFMPKQTIDSEDVVKVVKQ